MEFLNLYFKGVVVGKTKVHTTYKNKEGTRVPGVTTILGVLAKPALIHWAWKLGCEGKDYRKERDQKADIGTMAHAMIMCHLKGEKFDDSDYSKNDIDKAENAFIKYLNWEKEHPFTAITVEKEMVSEKYRFGGTADLIAKSNGDIILVDYKTGKGIYPEMAYQLAAYKYLAMEQGHEIANARILRIGRDESEGFEEKVFPDLGREWLIFENCLKIYNMQKQIKKGG